MKLLLLRTSKRATGIFGELFDAEGEQRKLFQTLEHAFGIPDGGSYQPAVQPGTYRCVRGIHSLSNGIPFETFMLEDVPGHDGILFHVGNYNKDSSGCILLGKAKIPDGVGKSVDAFKEFMQMTHGLDDFLLEVKG